MPAEQITIQGYARTLDALCDALGIERVAVVGNSMGGFVGAELALAVPDTRVERLVLVSAAGLSITELPAAAAVLAAAVFATAQPRLARLDATSRGGRGCGGRRCRASCATRRGSPPPLPTSSCSASGKPGFVPALDALTSYDFRDRLGEIEVPVLLVWGE